MSYSPQNKKTLLDQKTPLRSKYHKKLPIFKSFDCSDTNPNSTHQVKPPKHPLQTPHLPNITSFTEKKPRYTLLIPSSSFECNKGFVASSLKVNSPSSQISNKGSHSSRSNNSFDYSNDCNKSDIEKIMNEQNYAFSNIKSLTPQNKTVQIEEKSLKPKKNFEDFEKMKPKLKLEKVILPHLPQEPDQKLKQITIPIIPKAPFGVHKSYNELNVKEGFKTFEVIQDSKLPTRNQSISNEEEARSRILYEILLEKQKITND